MKERSVPHSEIRADGTKRYTVPAIFDQATNTILSDSHRIIEYLDKAYPDTHQVSNTEIPIDDFLRPGFEPNWGLPLVMLSTWGLRISEILASLDDESAAKYRGIFERDMDTTLGEFLEDRERHDVLWAETREAFRKADAWLKEAEARYGAKGPWITGEEIKLPDLALASGVTWAVVSGGEDSAVWKRIAEWDDGRWARMWEHIKPYSTFH